MKDFILKEQKENIAMTTQIMPLGSEMIQLSVIHVPFPPSKQFALCKYIHQKSLATKMSLLK